MIKCDNSADQKLAYLSFRHENCHFGRQTPDVTQVVSWRALNGLHLAGQWRTGRWPLVPSPRG